MVRKPGPSGRDHRRKRPSGRITRARLLRPETHVQIGLHRSSNPGATDESTDKPAIEGPIPEYDRYGDHTGHNYFRCTGCGVEAMRRRDLRDGGCKCNDGWE